MGTWHFETGAATHRGLVREENEDSYLVLEEIGLWLVADGVGGHVAGKLASSTVVETVATIGKPVGGIDFLARLEHRLNEANHRLRAIATERGIGAFGTTMVALIAAEGAFACFWCGDSRLYRLRRGQFVQLTHDHSEVQELIDAGTITPETARTYSGRNVITRAIGPEDELDLDLVQDTLTDGDIFVLCSDGLTNHVEEPEIAELAAQGKAQQACDALIERALAGGGEDNVTVIVVRCMVDPSPDSTEVPCPTTTAAP